MLFFQEMTRVQEIRHVRDFVRDSRLDVSRTTSFATTPAPDSPGLFDRQDGGPCVTDWIRCPELSRGSAHRRRLPMHSANRDNEGGAARPRSILNQGRGTSTFCF
jgi:hypothetical protein